jgi:flagellar hook assembly protein FlgD
LVTERSVPAPALTVVVAVALPLPVFGSVVADEAVAVLESTVPAGTAAPTATVNVKTALPTPNDAFVHEIEPVAPGAGVVQDQPAGDDSETNVVPAGSVSASAAVVALVGPPFVTVMVYVRFVPALTGSGVAIFVADMSADPLPTVVVAVAVPLAGAGSAVVDVTVAVFDSTVDRGTDGPTATTSVKTALPTPNDAFVHEIAPVAPTAGVVHDQPAGDESDTNVVSAGSVSASAAVLALLGPPLVTVMV